MCDLIRTMLPLILKTVFETNNFGGQLYNIVNGILVEYLVLYYERDSTFTIQSFETFELKKWLAERDFLPPLYVFIHCHLKTREADKRQ